MAGVIVSYYWRVFYGLDARGVPPLQITGLCVVLAMAAGAAATANPGTSLCRKEDVFALFGKAGGTLPG